jgi:hypothetical protein
LLFTELATPDLEFYRGTVRALGGDEYRGREGFERFDRARSENWEELQNVAEELRDLGDRVLVLGTTKGRGRASGAAVELRWPRACSLTPRASPATSTRDTPTSNTR